MELALMLSDDQLDALAEHVAAKLALGTKQDARSAYTVTTLAQELGMSPRAVRGAIERRELAAVKRGGRWIIAAQAVTDWAEPRHEGTTAASALPRPRIRTSRRAMLADVVRSLDADDEDR
jgi:excisionase family DNA binding protein